MFNAYIVKNGPDQMIGASVPGAGNRLCAGLFRPWTSPAERPTGNPVGASSDGSAASTACHGIKHPLRPAKQGQITTFEC
jgi:hypothetical protein